MKLLSVSDLHANPYLLGGLSRAVEKHDPDVVTIAGDTISVFEPPKGTLSPHKCARALADILDDRKVVIVRGNHDQYNAWLEFAASWPRPQCIVEGNGCEIGGVWFVGFPCTYVAETLELVEWRRWLPQHPVAAKHGIWLMHEPPTTDLASWFCVCGTWREPIERFSPVLVLTGHDHSTPLLTGCWRTQIGNTTVVCAGQGNAKLRYIVAEIEPMPGGIPRLISAERFEE